MLNQKNGKGWHFHWRRPPFGRELYEFVVLDGILQTIKLSEGKLDNFKWILCLSGYSTKLAFTFLENTPPCLEKSYCDLIWSRYVPSKISIFVWHLLLDRLPIKDNLLLRGVSLASNAACVLCGVHLENVNHVFAKCWRSQNLWSRICCWWGLFFVPPDNASNILL
ncbi:hypothetical protein SLA2020_013030 [Shorea laevis]